MAFNKCCFSSSTVTDKNKLKRNVFRTRTSWKVFKNQRNIYCQKYKPKGLLWMLLLVELGLLQLQTFLKTNYLDSFSLSFVLTCFNLHTMLSDAQRWTTWTSRDWNEEDTYVAELTGQNQSRLKSAGTIRLPGCYIPSMYYGKERGTQCAQ